MMLRGKSIEELRLELELIDRTIGALESLGRLRQEIPAKYAGHSARAAEPVERVRPLKPIQTQ
jgi:hypothetical protein